MEPKPQYILNAKYVESKCMETIVSLQNSFICCSIYFMGMRDSSRFTSYERKRIDRYFDTIIYIVLIWSINRNFFIFINHLHVVYELFSNSRLNYIIFDRQHHATKVYIYSSQIGYKVQKGYISVQFYVVISFFFVFLSAHKLRCINNSA